MRGAINIVNNVNSSENNCGLYITGIDKNEKGELTTQEANNQLFKLVYLITHPLCSLASKLGVTAIPENREMPSGIWIGDGSEGSTVYNYIEFMDKLTERLSNG